MHLFKPQYKTSSGIYKKSANWAVKFEHEGNQIVKTTATPNRALAKQRAQAIINEVREKGWKILKPKLPGARGIKIDTIIEVYQEFAMHGKNRPLAMRTLTHNIRFIRKMAKECGVANVHELSSAAFLASDWGRRLSEPSRAAVCRAVSSVFSADALTFYKDKGITIENPITDRAKWRARQPEGFRAPSRTFVQTLIEKANSELKRENPKAWCIFTLALCAGLRQGEATHVRWQDLGENTVDVRSTEEHQTKNYASRLIPLPSYIIESLRATRGNAKDSDYLAGNAARQVRFLSGWLREQGINDLRPIHYLRKLYGSLVATEHGLFTAKEYLGHSSVKVTEGYYADLMHKKSVDWMSADKS